MKDAFHKSIKMYDELSERCQLYRELIEQQNIVIKLLKISRKSTQDLIDYSNASNRIDEINKLLEL